MKSTGAIFIKQAKDIFKNPMVLVQFIVFPAVALVMTNLIAKPNEHISNNMFVTMMAAIFAGMALITTMAGVIAEDKERKSIRFLVMAGVKPHEYLLGTGGFILLAGVLVSVVFGLIGTFTGAELGKFLIIMTFSTAASVLLGASIGMLSKNQQSATAVSMPLAMIFGFVPMLASFSKPIEKAASFLYTQQLNVVVNDFSANFTKAMVVTAVNIGVLMVLFVLAYRKSGLRG